MPDINYTKERKDLLKQRLDKNPSPQEALLLKHKIVPIVTYAPREQTDDEEFEEAPKEYTNTSFIGKGMYGRVYRAAYKGAEVAVKVTSDRDESNKWQQILRIAEAAPADVSKHFPKIYEIIEDQEARQTLIIMELLAPLTSHLKDIMFSGGYGSAATAKERRYSKNQPPEDSDTPIAHLMKDPEQLHVAYETISSYMEYKYNIKLDQNIKQMILKLLLDYKPLSNNSNPLTDFKQYFTNGVKSIRMLLPEEQRQELKNADLELLFYGINKSYEEQLAISLLDYFSKLAEAGQFPWTYSVPELERAPYRALPETSSFLKALEYLESNGIRWHDTHEKNIMIRPSTGDLVLIDVGLFKT